MSKTKILKKCTFSGSKILKICKWGLKMFKPARFFKNYCLNQMVLTSGNGYEYFYLKNGWTEVSGEEFFRYYMGNKGNLVWEPFFLKDLVSLDKEERKEFLGLIESTFIKDCNCPQHYPQHFPLYLYLESLFEMYDIQASENYTKSLGGGMWEADEVGNVVGECILEQFNKKYSVPIKVVKISDDLIGGLDFVNIKEI